MYRRRIKRLCRDLANGKALPNPAEMGKDIIPTYGSDTVIKAPRIAAQDDGRLLEQINDQVMDLLFKADALQGDERDQFLFAQLKKFQRKNAVITTDNMADLAPNLKWIHIIGTGVEHLTSMTGCPNK